MTAVKIVAVLAAIWLLNVLFVVVHESGHALVASAFGAQIENIYISPTGLEGATTHSAIADMTQTNLILAAGVTITTIATVVALLLRQEIIVYVFGLRTVESLLNYSAGSDMLCLLKNIGPDTYIISMAMISITALCVMLCIHRRFDVIRASRAHRHPAGASSAPAAGA